MSKPNQNQTKLNQHNQPPTNPTTVCKPTPNQLSQSYMQSISGEIVNIQVEVQEVAWTQKLMGITPKKMSEAYP